MPSKYYYRRYSLEHKAEIKEYQRRYYLEHRTEILAKERRRDLANRHPCPICGVPIHRTATYCLKHVPKPKGTKSPSWKGGRIKVGRGYIFIYKPEHPKANNSGYVPEHVLVWEQTHGKPLPPKWEVHHLNGIKDDNRPVNLEATTSKKHRLIIPLLQKRIQELEALVNNQSQLL